MKPPEQNRWRVFASPGAARVVVAVGFFVGFFLYLWRRVEPALEYQRAAPAFWLHGSFFGPFFGYPGGLGDYAGAFLAQLNYVSWLGALVYAGLAGAGCFLTWQLLRKLSGPVPPVAAFGPAFLLVLLRQGYECPSLAPVLGWVAGLGLALGYARLPWARAWARLGACWGLGALLFYLTGLWPGLLLAALAAEFEVAGRKQWVLGLGGGLSAVGALLVMGWQLELELATVWKSWGQGAPRWLLAALYLFVPVVAALAALAPKRAEPSPALPGSAGSGGAPAKAARRVPLPGAGLRGARARASWLKADGFALIILILGWVAVGLLFDASRKARLQVDYYAGRKEYAQVLAAAGKLPALDAAREVRLHRALYHTGQLGESLFTYTNQTTWNLLASVSRELGAAIPESETLLELGQVNDAEHLAHEALEMEGDRPEILRLLAQVNLLKERPRAARVFLNVLARMPFQRAWAREVLGRVEGNPRDGEDPELTRIRGLMPSSDLPHNAMPTEDLLLQLLQRTARNRMAFEYLMAHYLLARQLDKFAGELKRLADFGYQGLPRHYEEAILLLQNLQGRAVDLGGRPIRPETRARFEAFAAQANRGRYEGAAGRQALAREWGTTYWGYFFRPAAVRGAVEERSTEGQ